jgi:hypothetical protein
LSVAEPELALEIDAPEIVGSGAGGQRGSLGAPPRAALMVDKAVAVEHGVDGADRGDFDVAGQAADEQFAELACPPMRLVFPETDNGGFELWRQLIGVAPRAARPV